MPGTSLVTPSTSQDINGLLYNQKWFTSSLTYSFPTNTSFYEPEAAPNGETSNNFGALTASQQTFVRWALQQYASVANVTFTEVTESSTTHADLRFARSDAPSTAWAYLPTGHPAGGDSWYRKSGGAYDNPVVGNYAAHTFLHELGHAMGLEHGHDTTNPFGPLPSAHDSVEYSLMTYRSYVGAPLSGYTYETWGAPQTLMQDDIAAVQYLYGANFNTNSGNTVYAWSPTSGQQFVNGIGQAAPGGNNILSTIWDGGGTDTFDFSNYASNLSVDLRPGSWTTVAQNQLADLGYYSADGAGAHFAAGNIANALLYNGDVRSLIENANGGSGSDSMVGNQAANILNGNGGNDILIGLAGNDVLSGGSGSDTAAWGGSFENYSVTFSVDAHGWSVNDGRFGSPDGIDFVSQIETFSFANGQGAVTSTGAETRLSFSFNTGGQRAIVYDQSGNQTWTTYANDYDAGGHLHAQSGSYRAGGSWFGGWDVSATQTWVSYTSNYNVNGDLILQVGNYDDGKHWVGSWDAGGAEPWTSYTNNYNAAWENLLQVGNYDNGNHWVASWDVAAQNAWSSQTTNYDPAWNPVMQVTNYDDGTHSVTTWVGGTPVTHDYDTGWSLIL